MGVRRLLDPLAARAARTPLYARVFPGTVVLLYHRIADVDRSGGYRLAVGLDSFRSQLEALVAALPPLALREVAEALRAGRPRRGFAVTFDDGYADNLEALPVLEELGVPATIFVATGALGATAPFAWDEPLPERERGRALRIDELERLAASPLVEIGAHTISHPRLPELPLEEQRREVGGGRDRLEQLLGRRVSGFAYPFGAAGPETVELVRGLGFDYACATTTGRVGRSSDVHALPRFRPGDWDGAGLWQRLERVLYLPRSRRPRQDGARNQKQPHA